MTTENTDKALSNNTAKLTDNAKPVENVINSNDNLNPIDKEKVAAVPQELPAATPTLITDKEKVAAVPQELLAATPTLITDKEKVAAVPQELPAATPTLITDKENVPQVLPKSSAITDKDNIPKEPPKIATFDDYMERLDRSATKRTDLSEEDLLKIIEMSKKNEENQKKLTDQRLHILFYLIERKIEKYTAQQLVQLMKDISEAKIDPNLYYKGFFSLYEKQLYEKMAAEKFVLFNSLKVYVRYNEELPVEFVEKWCKLMGEKIDEFTDEELVRILMIFAAKKVRPDNDGFLQKWSSKIGRKFGDFGGEILSDVVYACGKLNVEEMHETLKSTPESKILQMNGQQIVKTLYGLIEGKIEYNNGNENFYAQCSDILMRNMKSFNARDLARTIWVVSKNEIFSKNQDLYNSWENAAEISLENPTGISAPDLNTILKGLRQLKMTALYKEREISKKLLSSWMSNALNVMQKFWPEMLPNMVGDLCKLGTRPNEDFVKHWLMTLKHSLDKLYGRDYVSVITGLADNGFFINDYDSHFVESWCENVKEKSNFWSEAMKLNLKSAFKTMNVEINEKLEKILN